MGPYLASFLLVTLFVGVEMVQVNVAQGTLEGELLNMTTGDGQYYSFKGIPYAAAPVGKWRFKAPQPPVAWEGVKNATSHGPSCPQVDIFTGIKNLGSEDCLHLNVYTPNITPDALLPVMFFIHGGGFKSGSGNDSEYGPDILVNKSVVLVKPNYRLEVLGFLSLENEEVPGNAGLKDQVAALRWVNENIANFGGDPNSVTIFGQSAGGVSVCYHILSPMSKGLFKRAIAMSGVPFCDFATAFRPRDRAFMLGKQTGCSTNDSTVLLTCLQGLSVEHLVNTTANLLAAEDKISNFFKWFLFTPIVEKDFGNSSFITQNATYILKDRMINEVDMMFGATNLETVTAIDTINSTLLAQYDKYPESLVPTKMLVSCSPEVNLNVSKKVHEHYFSNPTIDVNVIGEFLNCTSQASFEYDNMRFIGMMPTLANNNLYYYIFGMSSGLNYYGNRGIPYGITGKAGHIDDLMYLFNTDHFTLTSANTTEYALADKFSTLVTNFAKYGNPTPKNTMEVTWPQFDKTNQSYLMIGNTLTVETKPHAEAVAFWKSIFEYVGWSFY